MAICVHISIINCFHHTGSLEVFHSLLLKYCPKWQHFLYSGMQANIELAILDHNYNTQREQATTKSGKLIMLYVCVTLLNVYRKAKIKVLFPKGWSTWVAKPMLQNKDYTHLTHMMNDILELQTHGKQQDALDFDKALALPQNIAMIEQPPKDEIITKHTSRFLKQPLQDQTSQ